MNQTQKRYALERLKEIRRTKFKAIDEAHPQQSEDWARKELVDMLKRSIKSSGPLQIRSYPYLNDVGSLFTIPEKNHARAKSNAKVCATKRDILRVAFDKACDEVMLGDEKKALQLLQNFVDLKL